jgi:hypothetical protein
MVKVDSAHFVERICHQELAELCTVVKRVDPIMVTRRHKRFDTRGEKGAWGRICEEVREVRQGEYIFQEQVITSAWSNSAL